MARRLAATSLRNFQLTKLKLWRIICTMHNCTAVLGGTPSINGIGESLQAVHAGDEGVLHATVLEFGHHLQPELRAFSLRDPDAQQFLIPIQFDTQRQIGVLDAHRNFVAHFDVDAVQINDGVCPWSWGR